jgi:hypothetical protein
MVLNLACAVKLCMHKPTSLTRNYRTSILPSQLDAWLWPLAQANIQVAGSGRLAGRLLASLSAYPVLVQQDKLSHVNSTATFQVAQGCFLIGLECAAKSAPPRLA